MTNNIRSTYNCFKLQSQPLQWPLPQFFPPIINFYHLMLLVIRLLTLLMSVGFNNHLILTQYVIRWVGLVLRGSCGVKMAPDFNPVYAGLERFCPDVSKNIQHLYVCIMLLENDLLTLSMGMGLKLPLYINPKCSQIGRPCPDVSKKV